MNDYDLAVGGSEEYRDNGITMNNLLSDLSAHSEEISATINNITDSLGEIALTIEDSTVATTDIAEKNLSLVDIILNFNDIMEKNQRVSKNLQSLKEEIKL